MPATGLRISSFPGDPRNARTEGPRKYPRSITALPDHLIGARVGRDRLPREVLDSRQRARVIEAAIAVFGDAGYAATSVDDLLAASRTGYGSFHSLFEGKDDCFLASFDAVAGTLRAVVTEAGAPAAGWLAQTEAGLRRLLEALLADSAAARLILIEARAAGPEATRRHHALLDEAIDWLRLGRLTYEVTLPDTYEFTAVAGLLFYLQCCLMNPAATPGPDCLFDEVTATFIAPMIR